MGHGWWKGEEENLEFQKIFSRLHHRCIIDEPIIRVRYEACVSDNLHKLIKIGK